MDLIKFNNVILQYLKDFYPFVWESGNFIFIKNIPEQIYIDGYRIPFNLKEKKLDVDNLKPSEILNWIHALFIDQIIKLGKNNEYIIDKKDLTFNSLLFNFKKGIDKLSIEILKHESAYPSIILMNPKIGNLLFGSTIFNIECKYYFKEYLSNNFPNRVFNIFVDSKINEDEILLFKPIKSHKDPSFYFYTSLVEEIDNKRYLNYAFKSCGNIKHHVQKIILK